MKKIFSAKRVNRKVLEQFLEELRKIDNADAIQFITFRELYHRSKGTARASVVLRMLCSWEEDPETPELLDCLNGLRELATFRFAEKICEKVKGQSPDTEQKIRAAIWVLKQAFAASRITISDSGLMN